MGHTGSVNFSYCIFRIVFQTFPAKHSVLEEELFEDDPLTCDSLRELCALKKGEPSPFSSRKVMYEREEVSVPWK